MKGEEELVERDGDELVEEEEEENEHGGIAADAPQAKQPGHCPLLPVLFFFYKSDHTSTPRFPSDYPFSKGHGSTWHVVYRTQSG